FDTLGPSVDVRGSPHATIAAMRVATNARRAMKGSGARQMPRFSSSTNQQSPPFSRTILDRQESRAVIFSRRGRADALCAEVGRLFGCPGGMSDEDEEHARRSEDLRLVPRPSQKPWLFAVGGRRCLGMLFPVRDKMVLGRVMPVDVVIDEEG